MGKILVTGGCGYIGSHTIADLLQDGYDVISIDNLSRSTAASLQGIEAITGVKIRNYKVDLCNIDETVAVFQDNPDISGIIHFAAYKEVGESVENPLLYYHNNLNSLLNILQCAAEYAVPNFIFSSSCTVYGNPDVPCVTEETPQKPAASAYGSTKQMGEEIVQQAVHRYPFLKAVLLRYFNPVGAHPTLQLGELPRGKPANLVPAITQTAIGKLPAMMVYGNDYATRDGSCLRDYIHIVDIAAAHTAALRFAELTAKEADAFIFNLGTGNGITVLEAIAAFEKVSGVALNYTIGPRRKGDVESIYANNDKAKDALKWAPQSGIETMMQTAWEWEKKIAGK